MNKKTEKYIIKQIGNRKVKDIFRISKNMLTNEFRIEVEIVHRFLFWKWTTWEPSEDNIFPTYQAAKLYCDGIVNMLKQAIKSNRVKNDRKKAVWEPVKDDTNNNIEYLNSAY